MTALVPSPIGRWHQARNADVPHGGIPDPKLPPPGGGPVRYLP